MTAQLCYLCHRPMEVCREPVDARWPARAREAYARADLTDAPTCEPGQAADIRATGWCWSRARLDRYWSGTPLTDAERKGVGLALEASGG